MIISLSNVIDFSEYFWLYLKGKMLVLHFVLTLSTNKEFSALTIIVKKLCPKLVYKMWLELREL